MSVAVAEMPFHFCWRDASRAGHAHTRPDDPGVGGHSHWLPLPPWRDHSHLSRQQERPGQIRSVTLFPAVTKGEVISIEK
jgi:hypothetical protein